MDQRAFIYALLVGAWMSCSPAQPGGVMARQAQHVPGCYAVAFQGPAIPGSGLGPFPDTVTLSPDFSRTDDYAEGEAYRGVVPDSVIPVSRALANVSPAQYTASWLLRRDTLTVSTLVTPFTAVVLKLQHQGSGFRGTWHQYSESQRESGGAVSLKRIVCQS
jgi:hypothetical protein